jgi:hypothetical protein
LLSNRKISLLLLQTGCNYTHCPRFRLHILNTRPNDLVKIKLCISTKRGISTIIQYIYAFQINIDIYNFFDTLNTTCYELGIEKVTEKCENFGMRMK